MRKCKECGAPLGLVRVIVVGTTTWREVRCSGLLRHLTVTREEIGTEAEYRRARTLYERGKRKFADTGIRKMRLPS